MKWVPRTKAQYNRKVNHLGTFHAIVQRDLKSDQPYNVQRLANLGRNNRWNVKDSLRRRERGLRLFSALGLISRTLFLYELRREFSFDSIETLNLCVLALFAVEWRTRWRVTAAATPASSLSSLGAPRTAPGIPARERQKWVCVSVLKYHRNLAWNGTGVKLFIVQKSTDFNFSKSPLQELKN